MATSETAQRPISADGNLLPRGVGSLEIGISPDRIRSTYMIREDQDPVVALIAKYSDSGRAQGVAESRKTQAIRFFRISSGANPLPEGATSADARSRRDIIYQIALHYLQAGAKSLARDKILSSYLSRFGPPTITRGDGYSWYDGRTRIDVEPNGDVLNVFFTDVAIENAIREGK